MKIVEQNIQTGSQKASALQERQEDTIDVRSRTFWLSASGLFLFITTLLHLGLVFRFPLAPDECYYWQWSRHLDLGYYDQGPMVAWVIRGCCLLLGDTPLGVRAGIVLASLGTQIFLFLLARDLFGPRIAFLSLIPATLTPLALAGSFIATYDPLVVLFWAACLYFLVRALFFDSKSAWIGAGLSFGLGMLSKHTMLLLAPCLLLFLTTTQAHRCWLRRPEPYLALLLGFLVFAPNLWWQSHHDWMTFRHLFLLTGKGTDQNFLRRLGDFVGSQFLLITPLLFGLYIYVLLWAKRRRDQERGETLWFLFCLSAPILLIFLLMTIKSKVQANWAVCGWLVPPILLAAWYANAQRPTPNARRLMFASLALSLFLSLILVVPEVRSLMHVSVSPKLDQMNKLYGGKELGEAADGVKQKMEAETGQRVAVGAVTYDNASRLAFYMTGQPDTCCLFPGTRLNSYTLWNERTKPKPGEPLLLVDDMAPKDALKSPFAGLFERVEAEPDPIPVYRSALYTEPVHTFYLYRCYNYRPDPRVETPSGG